MCACLSLGASGGQDAALGRGSKALFPLGLLRFLTGVKSEVLCPLLPPVGGATARGMQASHPTGSSLFVPCLCGSLPHGEQPYFPRAGFFFFKLSLDELTQVCFPFVVFKLLVRGRRKIEIWERGRKWSALSK
jgi:hypothetical protein